MDLACHAEFLYYPLLAHHGYPREWDVLPATGTVNETGMREEDDAGSIHARLECIRLSHRLLQ
jgi:hypothetical protein